jgi:antirestriction protein ArdC
LTLICVGSEDYAVEDIIVETASAFFCADLDLTPDIRDDHAAYIDTWLAVLKADKKAVFCATGQAQMVAHCLNQLQTKGPLRRHRPDGLSQCIRLYSACWRLPLPHLSCGSLEHPRLYRAGGSC